MPPQIIQENTILLGPEAKLSKLFEGTGSVHNVASLMNNLLETYESNNTDKGAPYDVKMVAESSNPQNLPIMNDELLKVRQTTEEETESKFVIRSGFKAQVKSEVDGNRDIVTHPLSIGLKNYEGLTEELVSDTEKETDTEFAKQSNASFNLFNQILTYAELSLTPFVTISNMVDAYIIRLPL